MLSFSITVTNRWMQYNIKRLTFGYLDYKLGKDKFGGHGIGYQGERFWIGARRVGYMRCYYLGNPAAYQYYWLSYNMSGVGVLSVPDSAPGLVERGVFCPSLATRIKSGWRWCRCIWHPVNTLTVLHPEGPVDEFNARHVLGPDESRVRLAPTIRLPTGRTFLSQLRFRWFNKTTNN